MLPTIFDNRVPDGSHYGEAAGHQMVGQVSRSVAQALGFAVFELHHDGPNRDGGIQATQGKKIHSFNVNLEEIHRRDAMFCQGIVQRGYADWLCGRMRAVKGMQCAYACGNAADVERATVGSPVGDRARIHGQRGQVAKLGQHRCTVGTVRFERQDPPAGLQKRLCRPAAVRTHIHHLPALHVVQDLPNQADLIWIAVAKAPQRNPQFARHKQALQSVYHVHDPAPGCCASLYEASLYRHQNPWTFPDKPANCGHGRPPLVALLPMKAHSERVVSKNFRSFAGKPLYRWILDSLLSLPEIIQVVINTDARALLRDTGLTEGGKIIIRDRKSELCGDHVSMNRILADDLAAVPAQTYLMTHTTNPLLRAQTIRKALAAFRAAQAQGTVDSLFSVKKYQTRFYRADGSAVNHDPANLIRTQDLEPWFEENSNLYIFTPESFAGTGARIGKTPLLFETPKMESADIDDADDWTIAEAIALQR